MKHVSLKPAGLLKSLNKLFHRCCHKSCHEDVNTGCRNMSRDSTKRSLSFANLSNQFGRSAVSSPLGVPRLNLVIHSSVRKSSSPFPWFPPQLACPACLESGELGRFYSDISAGGLCLLLSQMSNSALCINPLCSRLFIKHIFASSLHSLQDQLFSAAQLGCTGNPFNVL